MPRMALRVVCGVGEVMDTLLSQIVLRRVDLPDDGLPIMATEAHFMAIGSDFVSGTDNSADQTVGKSLVCIEPVVPVGVGCHGFKSSSCCLGND